MHVPLFQIICVYLVIICSMISLSHCCQPLHWHSILQKIQSWNKIHSFFVIVHRIWFDYCRSEHGVTYKSGPIAEIIYEASGSSVDWAHAKLGIKYAYALELRDDGTHGFNLPVNEIQPTVEETFAGIVGMADEIYKEFEGKASSSFGSNQNSGLVDVYKGPTTRVINVDDLPQKSPFFSEDWWKTDSHFVFVIYLHWLTCWRTDYPKLPIFNVWHFSYLRWQ